MQDKKICLIGPFDFRNQSADGQTVKTRELYHALSHKYGNQNVTYVETYRWKKHPLTVVACLVMRAWNSNTLIMLPAQRGVVVFSRILLIFQKINKRIYYDVIGGWLPEMVAAKKGLKEKLSRFDGIWVETSSMAKALEIQGFNNVTVVPNFKKLQILSIEEVNKSFTKPYRVCTFSRVMKDKGIEDAAEAVYAVNTKVGEIAFTLDIYGQIDPRYADRFYELCSKFQNFITYKGIVSSNESVQALKDYFALLFPTRYYTEGIPGTIIDAYAAGLPVITALWQNANDVFLDGVTGWGYEFGKPENLSLLLEKAEKQPEELIRMRKLCLQKANEYRPETVLEVIDRLIQ